MSDTAANATKILNKINAWAKGQNPWITVESSDLQTPRNRRFSRVRANQLWGDPKGRDNYKNKKTPV